MKQEKFNYLMLISFACKCFLTKWSKMVEKLKNVLVKTFYREFKYIVFLDLIKSNQIFLGVLHTLLEIITWQSLLF